jgi:hypothetical protein
MQLLTEGASYSLLQDAGKTAVQVIKGYHAPKAENHHETVGLTGGHHDLFMIDRILEKYIA